MIYSQCDWSSLALFGCVCEKKDEGKVERRCKCSAREGEGVKRKMCIRVIPLINILHGAASISACRVLLELACKYGEFVCRAC